MGNETYKYVLGWAFWLWNCIVVWHVLGTKYILIPVCKYNLLEVEYHWYHYLLALCFEDMYNIQTQISLSIFCKYPSLFIRYTRLQHKTHYKLGFGTNQAQRPMFSFRWQTLENYTNCVCLCSEFQSWVLFFERFWS